MKVQIKAQEKGLEMSKLSDVEFKTLVVRMFKELREDSSKKTQKTKKKYPVRKEGYTN